MPVVDVGSHLDGINNACTGIGPLLRHRLGYYPDLTTTSESLRYLEAQYLFRSLHCVRRTIYSGTYTLGLNKFESSNESLKSSTISDLFSHSQAACRPVTLTHFP
jgi:hypothetical protein